ncbi:FecR family protein [Bacteroidota bacterium]
MKTDIDNELLGKYLSGESTSDEKRLIEDWLNSDPENKKILNKLMLVFNNTEESFDSSDIDTLWNDLAAKAGISRQEDINIFRLPRREKSEFIKFPFTRLLKYAAVFILAIALPYFIFTQVSNDLELIEVPFGEQSTITLSDNTKITLDAGSTLEFPSEFDGGTREVYLYGEAYFTVSPDPQKPFIVHVKNTTVQVLGTKFNIRAWEENKIIVSVSEGKVEFAIEEADKSVVLGKGFASKLLSGNELAEPYEIDLGKSSSWINGEITLSNVSFKEVFNQLERWHNLNFNFADTKILDEKVSIFIQKNSLDKSLDVISKLTSSEFTKVGNEITFSTIN